MGVRLPTEYQEVEYIQSHGTEWINTGFSPTIETEVIIDLSNFNSNGNSYAPPFGLAISKSHVGLYKHGTTIYTSFGSRVDVTYATPYNWVDRIVISQSKNGVFENNIHVLSAYSNLSFAATAQNIYVFARSDSSENAARIVILKLYGLQINDNGRQVRNYIPCYRKSDNKPGLYDLVTREFYTNDGTGEFEVGPDVIDSISPWLVARRRALMYKEPELYPVGTHILSMYIGDKDSGERRNFEAGYGINTSTGEYYATGSGNTYASDVYVPVNPKYTYQKNDWRLNTWCFYDKDKQYISKAPSYNNLNVHTLAKFPANVRYVRIQAYNFANQKIEITRIA